MEPTDPTAVLRTGQLPVAASPSAWCSPFGSVWSSPASGRPLRASARPGRWPARGGGAESGPGGRPCRARPASAGRLDTGTAAIRRTLQRTSSDGLTTLPTKTRASERRIALPTRCLHSLKHHHEQQQHEREAAGTTWQHSGHMFTTAQGGSIDPTNLTRTFTTLLRNAGLRRIRFHDLRHSAATLLLEQGVELVVIKELLGHAHIGVTASVYAHVRLRLQRDAIDTLSTALDCPTNDEATRNDGGDPPLCGAAVR